MNKDYSIYKDETPLNTLKKIKCILDDIGLDLKEKFFCDENNENSPISLRVYNEDYLIGTNGKGTSINNAKASAYSEFMERLQNSMLIDFFPEVNIKRQDVRPTSSIFDSYTNKLCSNLKPKYEILLKNNFFDINKCVFLDFYNAKDNKVYKLPYSIIRRIDGSNGMAAGNTLEEAIVQACSEICERYAIRKVITEKIKMPDIDENDYIQYSKISNVLKYFKEQGLEIFIKDASCNLGLPCVCTVLINRAKNFFHLSFGAHPSLPVAIERTLTEFAQGKNIKEYVVDPCFSPVFSKEKLKYSTSNQLALSMFHRGLSFEINEEFNTQFLSKNVDYTYSKEAFVSQESSKSNKYLLDFILNKLFRITDDIYIRDNSFLGFPSVKVFIPEISEMFHLDEGSVLSLINCRSWNDPDKNLEDKKIYNINTLMDLAEYGIFVSEEQGTALEDVFSVTYEYIALLCSIVLRNYEKYAKFLEIILGQNKFEDLYSEFQIHIFEIIKLYLEELGKNSKVNENDLIEKLNKNFSNDEIDNAFNILKSLDYESILHIVLKTDGSKNKVDDKKIKETLSDLYLEKEINQELIQKILV